MARTRKTSKEALEEKIEKAKEEEIKPTISKSNISKEKDKSIDLGILIVVMGLFLLVITTYFSKALTLSSLVTNILVILSLVIEAFGIIVIIVNSIRKY